MQLCGALLLLLIQPFVEPEQDTAVADNNNNQSDTENGESLSEPLLSTP